jgi:hypothetical protein
MQSGTPLAVRRLPAREGRRLTSLLRAEICVRTRRLHGCAGGDPHGKPETEGPSW